MLNDARTKYNTLKRAFDLKEETAKKEGKSKQWEEDLDQEIKKFN